MEEESSLVLRLITSNQALSPFPLRKSLSMKLEVKRKEKRGKKRGDNRAEREGEERERVGE